LTIFTVNVINEAVFNGLLVHCCRLLLTFAGVRLAGGLFWLGRLDDVCGPEGSWDHFDDDRVAIKTAVLGNEAVNQHISLEGVNADKRALMVTSTHTDSSLVVLS